MITLIKQFLKVILPNRIIIYLGAIKFLPHKIWAWQNSSNLENFCIKINYDLWNESKKLMNIAQNDINNKIKRKYSGPGAYVFLYFITRFFKPKIIFETGVAAGWSSFAFLSAINKNEYGHLYSSDLPNNLMMNNLLDIGIAVPTELKNAWSLCIKGDDICLPIFLKEVKSIDIFHYDSDKSYNARKNVFLSIYKKLSKEFIIIFDDIHINDHFKNLIKDYNYSWKVFKFGNKYFGLIYHIKNLSIK